MHPELFHIPFLGYPIYSYGMMMVIAFLATQWLSTKLTARLGYDPEIFVNFTLIAMISGVIGSRLSHVLENLPDYTRSDRTFWQNLFAIINIRSGGLTYYGGVLLAFPVCLAWVLYKKMPGRVGMDIAAPCLTLGLAIGRIGCFLNGCCYGANCQLPWAVQFPYGSNAYVDQFADGTLKHPVPPQLLGITEDGQTRLLSAQQLANDPQKLALAAAQRSNWVHPAQLYSTLTSLLITALLLCYFTLPHAPGRVFALMLMIEGITRFLLELLRVEPPVLGPMSLSMILGLALCAVGGILWFAFGLTPRPKWAQILYAHLPVAIA